MIISNNIPALTANLNLTKSNKNNAIAMQRLSSGLKIQSAKDNPSGLAISNKMKKQIQGTQKAWQNSLDGVSLTQTADGGLSEIHNILQRQRELTVQALNGVYDESDINKIYEEIQQLSEEINSIASKTEYNTINLLAQKTHYSVTSDNSITSLSYDTLTNPPVFPDGRLNLGASTQDGTNSSTLMYKLNSTSHSQIIINDTDGNLLTGPDKILDLPLSQQTEATSPNSWETRFSLVSGNVDVEIIQTVSIIKDTVRGGELYDIRYDIVNNGSDDISISFAHNIDTCFGGDNEPVRDNPRFLVDDIEISGPQKYEEPYVPKEVSLFDEQHPYLNAICVFDDSNIINPPDEVAFHQWDTDIWSLNPVNITDSMYTAIWKDKGVPSDGVYSFNTLYGVTDPMYNPILNEEVESNKMEPNLIIQVGPNSKQEMPILLCDARTTALNIDDISIETTEAGTDALIRLDEAISIISDYRSRFGAYQNRLEHTISNLDTMDVNLQESMSRIQDADIALEMTEMSKNQVISQAGIAILAQANQRPQHILQLL